MNYISYMEALGIGFNDAEKLKMLKNRISNFLEETADYISDQDYLNYCNIVHEKMDKYYPAHTLLDNSFQQSNSIHILVSKFVAFCNTVSDKTMPLYSPNRIRVYCGARFLNFITEELNTLGIPYEIIKRDKDILIIPKGAEELDKPLVSDVLEWLNGYPSARSVYITALKNYADKTAPSNVADDFRKALETFFQEFFKSDRTLENLKSEYGNYLKEHGVPKEISNNLETLLKSYTDYNNNYAKHKSRAQNNVLEYIMHQTGMIIRLLITLNQ